MKDIIQQLLWVEKQEVVLFMTFNVTSYFQVNCAASVLNVILRNVNHSTAKRFFLLLYILEKFALVPYRNYRTELWSGCVQIYSD